MHNIHRNDIFLVIPKVFDDKCEQNINQFIDEIMGNSYEQAKQ